MDNIIDSNKSIAIFMGGIDQGRFIGGSQAIEFDKNETMGVTRCRLFGYDELRYNSSWDWLIPVVEKVEKLGFGVEIIGNYCKINDIQSSQPNKIEAIYKTILEFIKRYNLNIQNNETN